MRARTNSMSNYSLCCTTQSPANSMRTDHTHTIFENNFNNLTEFRLFSTFDESVKFRDRAHQSSDDGTTKTRDAILLHALDAQNSCPDTWNMWCVWSSDDLMSHKSTFKCLPPPMTIYFPLSHLKVSLFLPLLMFYGRYRDLHWHVNTGITWL